MSCRNARWYLWETVAILLLVAGAVIQVCGQERAAKQTARQSGVEAQGPRCHRENASGAEPTSHEQPAASMNSWMPTVRRMRPDRPWEDVVRVLNATADHQSTPERQEFFQCLDNVPALIDGK